MVIFKKSYFLILLCLLMCKTPQNLNTLKKRLPKKIRSAQIYIGGPIYVSNLLTLNSFGLFCFNATAKKPKLYIPLNNLSPIDFVNLQVFLETHGGLLSFDSIYKASMFRMHSTPFCYIVKTGAYSNIKMIIDYRNDAKAPILDSLRMLMTNLIPQKNRKTYSLDN